MTSRQEKVSKQIQKDIAEILQHHSAGIPNRPMLTVTNVRISPDLGQARIYLSIFPSEHPEEIIKELNEHIGLYRNELGKKLRHQLKKIPEIKFFLDDSLDYIDKIDKLLKK